MKLRVKQGKQMGFPDRIKDGDVVDVQRCRNGWQLTARGSTYLSVDDKWIPNHAELVEEADEEAEAYAAAIRQIYGP